MRLLNWICHSVRSSFRSDHRKISSAAKLMWDIKLAGLRHPQSGCTHRLFLKNKKKG